MNSNLIPDSDIHTNTQAMIVQCNRNRTPGEQRSTIRNSLWRGEKSRGEREIKGRGQEQEDR